MIKMITTRSTLARSIFFILFLGLVAGCSGARVQSQGADSSDKYVEVPNPAFTMSPGAPEKIWVPRTSVDNGVPRGGELVKRGYEAVKDGIAPSQPVTGVATLTPPQAGITAPGGKPAVFIPRFGVVVAVDGEKVYFNLGRDSGITPYQKLKVYRGGTVVEGLGLAPGEQVATIEVQGFVGTGGGFGVILKGGQLRINDLVGSE